MTENNKQQSLVKLLAAYGIYPARRFGQNFLVDRRHLVKHLQISELEDVKTILEIGPGPGNLTELLLKTGKEVLAVEIDERFIRLLNDRFGGCDNFRLRHSDILIGGRFSSEITTLLADNYEQPWAIIANLPYQISTTVVLEALHLPAPPAVMCVMVQKEVARRLKAGPGTKDYSGLSVLAQSHAAVELVANVPAGSFWPPPKVDSAIVKLVGRGETGIDDPGHLRRLVNAMFRSRRKTIRSGYLKPLAEEERDIAHKALQELEIEITLRAEQLPVETFIQLSNLIVRTQ